MRKDGPDQIFWNLPFPKHGKFLAAAAWVKCWSQDADRWQWLRFLIGTNDELWVEVTGEGLDYLAVELAVRDIDGPNMKCLRTRSPSPGGMGDNLHDEQYVPMDLFKVAKLNRRAHLPVMFRVEASGCLVLSLHTSSYCIT